MKMKSVAVIRRRLLLLWSQAVRSRTGYTCEVCGLKRGDMVDGKAIKLDAHHILSKLIKNSPLKYDIRNGVCLCSAHHKFGWDSFHKNPLRTIRWLQTNRPLDYQYILDNDALRVNLDHREVLGEIEARLREGKSLDLLKLSKI